MKAVILDIDGTLIDSATIESRMYLSAVGQVLGRVKLRDDWTTYQNVTDSGLLEEILSDNDIERHESVIGEVQDVFYSKLRKHHDEQGPFNEIPGARQFVQRLVEASGIGVAYATGGWQRCAQMKLRAAGFPLTPLPLVTSDEFRDRRSIMQTALRRLGDGFEDIDYYGDGLWDQKAAYGLGWNFVAVGARLGGIDNFHDIEI